MAPPARPADEAGDPDAAALRLAASRTRRAAPARPCRPRSLARPAAAPARRRSPPRPRRCSLGGRRPPRRRPRAPPPAGSGRRRAARSAPSARAPGPRAGEIRRFRAAISSCIAWSSRGFVDGPAVERLVVLRGLLVQTSVISSSRRCWSRRRSCRRASMSTTSASICGEPRHHGRRARPGPGGRRGGAPPGRCGCRAPAPTARCPSGSSRPSWHAQFCCWFVAGGRRGGGRALRGRGGRRRAGGGRAVSGDRGAGGRAARRVRRCLPPESYLRSTRRYWLERVTGSGATNSFSGRPSCHARHVPTPDLRRVRPTGDARAADPHLDLAVGRPDPDRRGHVGGEADEPAVAGVLGGAGLAGRVLPGDPRPGARATLHVLLEHLGGEAGALRGLGSPRVRAGARTAPCRSGPSTRST